MKKRLLFILLGFITFTGVNAQSTDLFISEYIEGSSFNKAIEVYNGTGSSVDLSNYVLKLASNGLDWSSEIALTGTLNDGDVYVISRTDADAAIVAVTDLPNASVINFNGDDAVGLFKAGSLIDVIGTPTADPGTAWAIAGTADATKDHTLVRKSTVISPNADWTVSAGTSVENSEWVINGLNDFSFIGSHQGPSVGPSSAADILTFVIANQQGASIINATNHTVSVTMPQGTILSALSPAITVSANANISPASGTAQNFSVPVEYMVTAENGSTVIKWTVTVLLVEPVVVLFEDDFETGTLTKWTTISVIGDQVWAIDATHGVTGNPNCAKVSGYAGASNENEDWIITPVMDLTTVIEAKLSFYSACNYTGNDILVKYSTDYSGSGAPSAATWTNLTGSLSAGSWAWTPSGDIDLSSLNSATVTFAFVYTSTATESKTWELDKVKVIAKPKALPSTETDITSFSFTEQTSAAVIDNVLHKVTIEVANGAPVATLIPTIEVSEGATINPASGLTQDFTGDVIYTVTAEDGLATQDWTVSVTVSTALSSAAEILAFSLVQEVEPAVINSGSATITSLVKWDTDLTSLTPSLTFSFGSQISPTTWSTVTDFSSPVKYDVTAQDGITLKKWTVNVTKDALPNTEAEITAFELSQLAAPVVINAVNGTITGEVVYGTNLGNLNPTITVSEGAVVSPSGAQDFTNTLVYTVTAEDGIVQKAWSVTLTVKALEFTSIYDIQYTTDAAGVSPLLNKTVKIRGVVTGKDSKSICIQDGIGAWNGIYVYKGTAIDVAVGDSVIVEGTVAEYSLLTEIKYPVVTIVNSGNVVPDAAVVTNLEFNQEKFESVIVEINNVTCSAEVAASGNWTVIDQSSNTVMIRNQFYTFTPALGQNFTSITGIGTQFNADFQLQPRSETDILISAVSDEILTQIAVSPNPFTNELNIGKLNGISTISISNILGQNLMVIPVNQSVFTINTAELSKGIYIITFEGMNGDKRSKRIIKQ